MFMEYVRAGTVMARVMTVVLSVPVWLTASLNAAAVEDPNCKAKVLSRLTPLEV